MRIFRAAQNWFRNRSGHEGRAFAAHHPRVPRSRSTVHPAITVTMLRRTACETRPSSERLVMAPTLLKAPPTTTYREREAIGSRRAAILLSGVYEVGGYTMGIDHTRGRRIARTQARREGLKAKLYHTLLAA